MIHNMSLIEDSKNKAPDKAPFFFNRKVLIFFISPQKHIQSTHVISNSKGLSEILRDIHTSTYMYQFAE